MNLLAISLKYQCLAAHIFSRLLLVVNGCVGCGVGSGGTETGTVQSLVVLSGIDCIAVHLFRLVYSTTANKISTTDGIVASILCYDSATKLTLFKCNFFWLDLCVMNTGRILQLQSGKRYF